MSLRLPDDWIWDFWLADTGTEYHIFYLRAPRSFGDPELRHANATVGHAVSDDLSRWTVLPDAIAPGEPGSWDDRAIWTGSIIEVDDVWYMLYTGTSIAEGGNIQRIGLATSSDLTVWTRAGDSPVIDADGRWYEKLDDGEWPEEAWRDPWVVLLDGKFHALITARSKTGPSERRGVIGHAVSGDLHNWDVQPPLSDEDGFAHIEVPQTVEVAGRHFLVFSCQESRLSSERKNRPDKVTGDRTYMAPADGPLGRFRVSDAIAALPPDQYSGRLIQNRDGIWVWLAFVARDDRGAFAGYITDPTPLNDFVV